MQKKGDAELTYFAPFYIVLALIVFFMLLFNVKELIKDGGPRAAFIAEDVVQIINAMYVVNGDIELNYEFGEGYVYDFSLNKEENKVSVGKANRMYADGSNLNIEASPIKDANKLSFEKKENLVVVLKEN